MANPYLVYTKHVLDGTVNPDAIEHRYVILSLRDPDKVLHIPSFIEFMEALNYLAKYGWRPITTFTNGVLIGRESA